MAVIGKLAKRPFLVVRILGWYGIAAALALTRALVAGLIAAVILIAFAAKRLAVRFAAKFGFRLVKNAKFAARDIDAKRFANKFLAA